MNVPLSPDPLRVIQISDPHLFAQRDQRLLNVDTDASLRGVVDYIQAHEKNIDLVLATGDISQDGSPEAYQRFLELTGHLAPVLRGLPGNHDKKNIFYEQWNDHAQAITDLGPWRVVLLDSSVQGSSAGHLAPCQLDLLSQAITTSEDRHILLAVHHNPIPIGSGWLDTMMIDNGHHLFGMLQHAPNVRALIWGHVHQQFDSVYSFHHRHADGKADQIPLRLLATPATCVQFAPHSLAFSLDDINPGYRRLELYKDGRIVTEVVRVPGLNIQPDTRSSGY